MKITTVLKKTHRPKPKAYNPPYPVFLAVEPLFNCRCQTFEAFLQLDKSPSERIRFDFIFTVCGITGLIREVCKYKLVVTANIESLPGSTLCGVGKWDILVDDEPWSWHDD